MKTSQIRFRYEQEAVSHGSHSQSQTGLLKRLVLSVMAMMILWLPACSSAAEPADLHGYSRTDHVTDYVAIVMKGAQEAVIIQLRPDKAPLTVENFQSLVAKGFYNGLTFHRVIDGYLIQGGDPNGDGSGGPGYAITGEFSLNGISNDLNHERGSISMARTAEYDSAGSQFFICQNPMPDLDREYAVFGMVIAGMSVVDTIAGAPNSGPPQNRPTRKQVMAQVFFVSPES